MLIEQFTQSHKAVWDEFVSHSKNASFLFLRDYMDYHADRFPDHSLLIRDPKGRLVALLPGHRTGELFTSHAGLTYGGFLSDSSMKVPLMLRVFDAVLTHLKAGGITQVIYKTIPHIYHALPAEEDRYALCLLDARWTRSGMLAVIDPTRRIDYQERRARGVRKAKANGLTVAESEDFAQYWEILSSLLWEIYQTKPIHSLDEIRRLHAALPGHIRLFGCFQDGAMLAGVVVYESALVSRTQYIASTPVGRSLGALDLLFDALISDIFPHKRYIELGTSDEDGGRRLNEGLIDQKEGFGARAVALDQYAVDLAEWQPGSLNAVLA